VKSDDLDKIPLWGIRGGKVRNSGSQIASQKRGEKIRNSKRQIAGSRGESFPQIILIIPAKIRNSFF
jgi:hypothetical protein